jgi:hypothetical protein
MLRTTVTTMITPFAKPRSVLVGSESKRSFSELKRRARLLQKLSVSEFVRRRSVRHVSARSASVNENLSARPKRVLRRRRNVRAGVRRKRLAGPPGPLKRRLQRSGAWRKNAVLRRKRNVEKRRIEVSSLFVAIASSGC